MSKTPDWLPLRDSDVDAVYSLEAAVAEFPWTRGHFSDSLKAGYSGWVCRSPSQDLIGYFILMACVDEMHLLNIGVAPGWQGQGWGSVLLARAMAQSVDAGMHSLLLEVRPSNARALALYGKTGFAEVGRRKGYYPTKTGREDAVVMRRVFSTNDTVGRLLEARHAA